MKIEQSRVLTQIKSTSLYKAKKTKESLRIVCISDTHGLIKDLKVTTIIIFFDLISTHQYFFTKTIIKIIYIIIIIINNNNNNLKVPDGDILIH